MVQDKPPEAITLQPANQPDPNRQTNTFSCQIQQVAPMISGQATMPDQQPLVVSSGKPSPSLMLGGFLIMIGSIGVSIFGFFGAGSNSDQAMEQMFCCLLCNGNATGLGMMAVYSFRYGAWERSSGKQGSAVMSYIVGAIALLFGGFLSAFFFINI